MDILQQQMADQQIEGTCQARDYDLDICQTPEEINTKLGYIRNDPNQMLSKFDFAKEYPPASAETNFHRILKMMLHSERDNFKQRYWQ